MSFFSPPFHCLSLQEHFSRSSLLRGPEQVRELVRGSFSGIFIALTVDKFYVCIIANQNHTVFYTGFIDDVERRAFEHKDKLRESFT